MGGVERRPVRAPGSLRSPLPPGGALCALSANATPIRQDASPKRPFRKARPARRPDSEPQASVPDSKRRRRSRRAAPRLAINRDFACRQCASRLSLHDMFDDLSEKLEATFPRLRGRGVLTEAGIKE